ncbi:MAG: ABC transporter ATP-binding protein [Epsilonproteobacteria bacterium]|nr:ABC transporter ATP-binding protein [Campylobacterota bacterium]
MLKVKNLEVYYGVIAAVRGIDFHVKEGNIVTLIGSNGAGKTSTLNAIVNSVKKKGVVEYFGVDIAKLKTHEIIQRGVSLVPEGRRVFINLTVDENLRMGAFNNDENFETLRDEMYEMFPRLASRKDQLAGTMSGGEQQMLAIARALMSETKLLMLDEPSLGLAPKIVGELFEIIQRLKENITILLVEQNAFAALKIADYAYVLENGSIALEDKAEVLLGNDEVRKKYLGG